MPRTKIKALQHINTLFLKEIKFTNTLSKVFQVSCQSVLFFFFLRDFHGGPVFKTPPFNAESAGLIPGWGAKIPHAPCGQEHKT